MGLIEDVYKVLAGTCGFQLKTGFTALYITINVLGLQEHAKSFLIIMHAFL